MRWGGFMRKVFHYKAIDVVVQSLDDTFLLDVAYNGISTVRIQTGMTFKEHAASTVEEVQIKVQTHVMQVASPHYTKRSTCQLEVQQVALEMGQQVLHLFFSSQGFAYRWESRYTGEVTVLEETFRLTPMADFSYLYAYHNKPHREDPFQNSWESIHHFSSWREITAKTLIYLPLTMIASHVAVALTEAELIDYPGLNLEKSSRQRVFTSLMARAPTSVDASNGRHAFVTARAPYLTQTQGARLYPWRICMLANTPAKLYENDLPYILSQPPTEDFHWVTAGRVAWDWWNAWGLKDVPFTPGVNMATYQAYIDFAEAFRIPYVILDEGWSQELDLWQVTPALDLPTLIAYGKAHHVKLILWSAWPQLIDCQEAIFEHYSAMGIAGFKVDFFDRDDCAIARMLYTTARIAARYQLVLAYHGIHKPTGLSRTYPNVLTYEGVFGLENTKWTSNEVNFVQNDVRLAFARLLAGPMDYTPGAMTNRHRRDFRLDYYHPMSMGTRCHQAAMFVLYDTGLQMLCDAPTAYAHEAAYTHFLTTLPLLWEETIALPYSHPEGCLAVWRTSASTFVFAVLNNDQARIITLPTWLLPPGDYLATALVDGAHVATHASDYRFETQLLSSSSTMDIFVAAGGGCVVTLIPK